MIGIGPKRAHGARFAFAHLLGERDLSAMNERLDVAERETLRRCDIWLFHAVEVAKGYYHPRSLGELRQGGEQLALEQFAQQ